MIALNLFSQFWHQLHATFIIYNYKCMRRHSIVNGKLNVCKVISGWDCVISPQENSRLTESITMLRKRRRNPIQVSNICNPRRGLLSCACCKSWTQGWDSGVPPTTRWLIIFLLLAKCINPTTKSNKQRWFPSSSCHIGVDFLWRHSAVDVKNLVFARSSVLSLGETAWSHHRKIWETSVLSRRNLSLKQEKDLS